VRDEPPNLNVIAVGIDAKMTLDRMRLTGHAASLHVRAIARRSSSSSQRATMIAPGATGARDS
jgi:hypothetical protein